jgi:DNA-binding transcriptional LysR family regulator
VDTLTSIKVFRQVIESGTFVAAAERMDLSTAVVSKHVAQLEQRLGVRLLNRNSRTLSFTEPGRVYFERCKTILDDLEATELELGSRGTAPRGTLRVTCPSWFARQTLADELVEFRGRYPQILVDVSFEDRFVDLVEEGYDLALRALRLAGSRQGPSAAMSTVTAIKTVMTPSAVPNLRFLSLMAFSRTAFKILHDHGQGMSDGRAEQSGLRRRSIS